MLGFKISSSKLRREVIKVAELSEKFVDIKQHIYQGIEAIELPKKHFHTLVDATVSLIDGGKVRKIIKNFQNYQGTGAKEIETLANYLIRFRSLRSLSKISEFRITNWRSPDAESTPQS